MANLSHLKKPGNKRKLNALLHIYRAYKNFILYYLDNPKTQDADDLNIFYMRELVPKIKSLVIDLKLDQDDVNIPRLPLDFLTFPTLHESEQLLRDQGKNIEDARINTVNVYGKIKQLVEKVNAVNQTPIQKIEKIIAKSQEIIEEQTESIKNIKSTEEVKESKVIKIIGDQIVFKGKPIPVERGQKMIAQLFLSNAKIYRGESLSNNGRSLSIEELRVVGKYKDESAFRNALSKLRTKLRVSEWPVTIENPETKMYKMEIKYRKKT